MRSRGTVGKSIFGDTTPSASEDDAIMNLGQTALAAAVAVACLQKSLRENGGMARQSNRFPCAATNERQAR